MARDPSQKIHSASFEDSLTLAQLEAFIARVRARLPVDQVRIRVDRFHESGDEQFVDHHVLEAYVPPPPQPRSEVRVHRSVELLDDLVEYLGRLKFRKSIRSRAELVYASLLKLNDWTADQLKHHPRLPEDHFVPRQRPSWERDSSVTIYIPTQLDETLRQLAGDWEQPVASLRRRVIGLALILDEEATAPKKKAKSKALPARTVTVKKSSRQPTAKKRCQK